MPTSIKKKKGPTHLLFLLFGLFALCGDVLLAMVVKLSVLLCFHHLFLPAVVLLGQIPGAGDLLKQSRALLGVLHGDGLHRSLEKR